MTKKELKDMTLEELWQLFPIFLVPPKKEWAEQYAEMEKRLSDVLSGCPVFRIGHIGSTAVPGIWAKDIVDVLVEIDPTATLEEAAKCLDKEGFTRMFTEDKRISLNFGYTKKGFSDEVYHIHLRYTGDNDELYFRDYLIAHPDIAKEYETLKKRLWKEYEHDRDAYTESKTAFIQGYTSVAKKEYAGRYENHAILTERLFLRPWKESDAEDVFSYVSDPEIGPPCGWAPHKSVEETREIIRTVLSGPECYAVCRKTDGKVIGNIEIKLNGATDMTDRDDECEIGYWMGKPFWGHGFMPEAMEAILLRAFTELGMRAVWCGYYDGNNKSKRVQEKCGFIYHHTTPDLYLSRLNETRVGHANLLKKEDWEKKQ